MDPMSVRVKKDRGALSTVWSILRCRPLALLGCMIMNTVYAIVVKPKRPIAAEMPRMLVKRIAEEELLEK